MSNSSIITCLALPYVEWYRPDVIAAVPPAAKTVLSVGCAGGITEAELVKQGMKLVGIELNPEAVRIARQRGLIVLEGDASEIDLDIAGETYDCIIYADILEHLRDPVAVLQRHVKYLKPNGIVYVSIPNFRHYSVFWELFAKGHIRYKEAGILDRTHLRMTTRKMVLEWFEQARIELVNCKYVAYRRRDKLFSACTLSLAREFTSVQIRLVGRKR